MKTANNCAAWVILFIIMAVLGSVLVLAFLLPIWAVRLWAVLVTFGLPIVLVIGLRAGQRDTKLMQDGLDLGITTVLSAANRAALFRSGARETGQDRQAIHEVLGQTLQEPPPRITLLQPGQDDDIIDL